ncbi:MAG: alpha/beta hydrolase [Devosia sp.]|uniref:alpha/beta hydrolase n=1 Tax=Devosia sp. TaxID=1871048 RepID=UPI001AD4896B|nr:alpha/beta hydrolase [Devosia sp.]MBN9316662.1 alpha/beta hydrolase [Devosia sp.]
MNTTITAPPDRQPALEAPDAEGVYRIWPGAAPGSEGWTWSERTMPVPWPTTSPRRLTRNVVTPTVTAFRPAPGKATGAAMVIAPGGAFHFLLVDHEGYDMARWLAGQGVTCFVLKYRLGRSTDDDAQLLEFRNDLQARLAASKTDPNHPMRQAMHEARLWGEEDGRQAIRFVRANAAHWGIDPNRIGITGFSAGGGVTMGPVLEHDAQSRPDFAAPIYAAWREGAPVPADACPLFIVISDDDGSVPALSSLRLYEAWHKAGKPVELHIFGNGGHGYGMAKEGWLSDPWPELLANWLKLQGVIAK